MSREPGRSVSADWLISTVRAAPASVGSRLCSVSGLLASGQTNRLVDVLNDILAALG